VPTLYNFINLYNNIIMAEETTTSVTAQEEAVRKAQEIVARLTNQYPIVVAGTSTNGGAISATTTNAVSTNNNDVNAAGENANTDDTTTTTTTGKSSKRKRWGIMGTTEGSSSSSFHEENNSNHNNNDASKRLHVNTDTTTSTTTNTVTANAQIPIAQLLMGTGTSPSSSSSLLMMMNANGTTPTNAVTPEVIVKRLWVTVNHERPAAHYIAYMKPKLKRIVAHANGTTFDDDENEEGEEKDDHTEKDATQEDPVHQNDTNNAEEEEEDPTKLRIVFKGKGSTNIPPLPGVPEEPLHIYMTGPKSILDSTITNQVDALIVEASRAEPLIAAVIAAQQAQERALITTMESIQTNTFYQPKSVTSLIHGTSSNHPKDNKDSNQLLALPADRLAAALLHGTTAALTQEMEVPNHVVGTIIGRGGETIASIQAQTNCKLQIQKEQDMIPGQINRIITMSANSQSAIDACQSIIQSLVQERIQKMNATHNHNHNNGGNQYGGGPGIGHSSHSNVVLLLDGSTVPSHHSIVEVLVPDADVGLIIGKMGGTS
jgi:predicted RNA-binding protein YlqC (UPF0109 family)